MVSPEVSQSLDEQPRNPPRRETRPLGERVASWARRFLVARGSIIALTVAAAGTGAVSTQLGDPCPVLPPAVEAVAPATAQPPSGKLDEGLTGLQLAGSERRAREIVNQVRANCGGTLAPAVTNIRWDFVFIAFYSVFLVIGTLAVAMRIGRSFARFIGFALAILSIVAAFLDLFENFGLLKMLGGFSGEGWPLATRIAAIMKFGFALPSFLFVMGGLGYLAFRQRRPKSGYDPARSADGLKRLGISVPLQQSMLPGAEGEAAKVDHVLAAEFEHVYQHRHAGRNRDHVRRNLVGLAFSGGGIRSATTNLGVLQALAELKVLPFVDYLCTVSGGGYIGSALASLLSLNAARVPSTPSDADSGQLKKPAEHFEPGDVPKFDTGPNFPFRDDRDDRRDPRGGRLAADLIGHLRTHGSFLIARRGLVRRDTMRAIGSMLTGISFNIFGFVVVLFTATALYLFTIKLVSPRVDAALAPPLVAQAPQLAVPMPVAAIADTVVERKWSRPCTPPDGCAEGVGGQVIKPSLAVWTKRNLSQILTPIRATLFDGTEDGRGMRLRVWLMAAVALLITLIGVAAIGIGGLLTDLTEEIAKPLPGESLEDSLDKALLLILTFVTLGIVLLSALGFAGQQRSPIEAYDLVGLWVPLFVMFFARILTVLVCVSWPYFRPRKWTRKFRSHWAVFETVTIYGVWISVIVVVLAPLMYALSQRPWTLTLSGIFALGMVRLFTPGKGGARTKFALPPGLLHTILAIAVVAVVLCGVLAIGSVLLMILRDRSTLGWLAFGGIVLLILLGIFVDHNKTSPHYFYRDRLAETYLRSEIPDADRRMGVFRDSMELPLAQLHGDIPRTGPRWPFRNRSPYLLISAAINLASSRDLTRKDRKSGYWLFSKLYCGSTHTGFRPTAVYRNGETKLARAVAVSGAAASSGIGFKTFFAQAFATVLFNVRLGYWVENPLRTKSQTGHERTFWPPYLWREITAQTNEHTPLVNLSDGGHTGDNVGLYPLLQRRCKVIIISDAEQDPALAFGSFTEALRHAYIDLGISVDIDLSLIRPDEATGRSRSHAAVGRIRYPDRADQASYLIYMKNSLTGDEPEPVLNYKVSAPAFPHESTADQFFDDAQFESYRALGVHITKATFKAWSESPPFDFAQFVHQPT